MITGTRDADVGVEIWNAAGEGAFQRDVNDFENIEPWRRGGTSSKQPFVEAAEGAGAVDEVGSRKHRTRSGVLEHEGEPFGRELGIERHERRS